MRVRYRPLLLVCAAVLLACGPASTIEDAPARLEVTPTILDFSAGEATRFLEVKNTGGGNITFAVKVSAAAEGIVWLKVEPDVGAVGPGSSTSLLVSVVDWQNLLPGSYVGEITVEAEGQDSASVAVTLLVGQPELELDPVEGLEFDLSTDSIPLLVKNGGKGQLKYTMTLPGNWLSVDQTATPLLGAGETSSILVTVHRDLVPWYGLGEGSLVVVSNGLTSQTKAGTVKLPVKVHIDDQCVTDLDCSKSGFFCNQEEGGSKCVRRRWLAEGCQGPHQCLSGFCADGVCCGIVCDAQCEGCNEPGQAGLCSPRPDGAPCEDGLVCTEDDECALGQCSGAADKDCASHDTACSDGFCDEEADGCTNEIPPGKCLIAGQCFDDGDVVGATCKVCDPAAPTEASNAEDGGECDDGDLCTTDDSCAGGECFGQVVVCSDELDCTDDVCDPETGQCVFERQPDSCIIGGVCVELGGTPGDGPDSECLSCIPYLSGEDWSPYSEGQSCDDGSVCSPASMCQTGVCQPVGALCDDDDPCTTDTCVDPQTCEHTPAAALTPCGDDGLDCTMDVCTGGVCTHPVGAGTCLIAGECYLGGAPNPANPCTACNADTEQKAWTSATDVVECDDGDLCTTDDSCAGGECLGQVVVCTDELDCTDDVCDPDTGQCVFERQPDSCIIGGVCVEQGANPGEGPDSQCLSCIPYLSGENWSAYSEGQSCDDGSVCSPASTCQAGVCQPVGALCDDGDPCTTDTCTDMQTCEHLFAPDLIPCDSDGNDCTMDVCATGICTHPIAAGNCLVGGQCYVGGALNPDNVCEACNAGADQEAWTATNDGMQCDDSNWCTLSDLCAGGECMGQLNDCDATQCENHYCDPLGQKCNVWPKPDDAPCDDGDACTVGDACFVGTCVGEPKDCAAQLQLTPCTKALCDSDSVPEPGKCYAQLLPGDTECDDGLACTTDTKCSVLGACTGGQETSDSDCAQLLGIAGQCTAAVCQEPGGCQPVLEPDGTECLLDNSVAKCEDGLCALVECVDELLYGNCDQGLGTGCETELWHDIAHCGECGHLCTFPNAFPECANGLCGISACKQNYSNCDGVEGTGCESNSLTDAVNCGECGKVCTTVNPSKVGVCQDKTCDFEGCPLGTQDMDGDPSNGCECTVGGQEQCNGLDDDCNGEVDEGFDLWNDLENCGACGSTCDVPDVAGFDCQNGQCVVTACPPGLVDLNGDTEDGCEYEPFFVAELWVDSLNGGGPNEDGSLDNPYDTIQEAVDAALPSYKIHVNEGLYSGGIIVDKVGLVLAGAGADLVSIATADGETGFLITAHDVALLSMTVTGGRYGAYFQGEVLAKLVGGVVSAMVIQDPVGPYGASLDGAGVFLEYADGITVSGCAISDVAGGQGQYVSSPAVPHVGGLAAGIRLRWSDEAIVVSNSIIGITGGLGGARSGAGGDGCTLAPPGGPAAGVWLEHSAVALLAGNIIDAVTGGMSGPGGKDYCSSANTGGLAAGIRLGEVSLSNHLVANKISNLVGGLPNPFPIFKGVPQEAFGIYLDDDSLDNEVAVNNSLEGDPVVYLHGEQNVEISGLSLAQPVNPTNLGKIVVIESQDIVIKGNEVGGFAAEAGYLKYGLDGEVGPTPGMPARGIYVSGCAGCSVVDNQVEGIIGGAGGRHAKDQGSGASGGDSIGIALVGCESCLVRLNTVRGLAGGDCTYASTYPDWGHGGAGISYGIWNSAGVIFENNVAVKPQAGVTHKICDEPAYCVYLDQVSGLSVKHLTCHEPGSECGIGYGIVLGEGQEAPVPVVNSIISTMTGFGLVGKASNTGLLSVNYSDLFGCISGQAKDANVGPGCLDLDPLFLNPDEDNVSLTPSSPAIDKGHGSADCSNEPFPNGCRVNMGAFGNTSQAASAAGDPPHCQVCPE